VAVGSNTVLVDNPQLTVRGLRGRDVKNPIRLVLDGSLHTDARSAVYQANHDDAYVIHTALAPQERIDAFDEAGVNRIVVASEHGHISLTDVLWALPQIGIASVLFECGSKLLTEFLRAGLFDELWWMVSPAVFGAGGPNAVVGDLPPELTQRIDWAGPVNLECDSLFLGRRKD
jgi:diaminohydroxyphosphoribosylaminopyrimidine deaminase/5-amino-6-(5-phosphoribosylamino)uracil reductase